MLPRINTQRKKNQNKKHLDNAVREEQKAKENIINIIGNEAANNMPDDFSFSESNEANNKIIESDETLSHYAENDLNKYVLNTGEGKKQKETPPEIIKDGLAGYYENDLNNLTLNKPKVVKEKKKKKTNLINKPIEGGMSEKDEPDNNINNINNIIEDEPLKLIEPLINNENKQICTHKKGKKGSK